jgi:hypothetical protein
MYIPATTEEGFKSHVRILPENKKRIFTAQQIY